MNRPSAEDQRKCLFLINHLIRTLGYVAFLSLYVGIAGFSQRQASSTTLEFSWNKPPACPLTSVTVEVRLAQSTSGQILLRSCKTEKPLEEFACTVEDLPANEVYEASIKSCAGEPIGCSDVVKLQSVQILPPREWSTPNFLRLS